MDSGMATKSRSWFVDWRPGRERCLIYVLAAMAPIFFGMTFYAVHLLHEQSAEILRVYRLTDAQAQMLSAGRHPAGSCVQKRDHSI